MHLLLWWVPAIPFAGAIVLAVFGPHFSHKSVGAVGVGAVGLSALLSVGIAVGFLISPPPENHVAQTLWTWIAAGDLTVSIGLFLDPLSLIMIGVVTFVGFLIHLYSAEYMAGEEGYSRFFCYMNLFIASMVTLVLADNLLLIYLGWEGVGLCSYLLIGFWYADPNNGRAAQKAFIVTRIGDTAFAVGLFLLFYHFRTLQIAEILQRAGAEWSVGAPLAIAASALLLGGAVGKSAQFPLQVWLPDAMAGPTPTSALMHAATMVTAGVYLIARTHTLFQLAPPVQEAVAVIGASTMLLAGFSALTQWDIKRVLAYSTISQIGYMFLALGVGAWSAAIFHLMTHAFFKSLLFLTAGVIIRALHEEHNIYKMGGLRRKLPLAFWTFLIGSASLAGLPLITAGFYSKGLILWETWAAGDRLLWLAGLLGVLLTALYIFRVIFLVFFGAAQAEVEKHPGAAIQIPLLILSTLSIIGGLVNLPLYLGGRPAFTEWMRLVLPHPTEAVSGSMTEIGSETVATAAFLIGLFLAYLFFFRRRPMAMTLAATPIGKALHDFWFSGWRFDRLYNQILIRPFVALAELDRHDVIDWFYDRVLVRSVVALAEANQRDVIDGFYRALTRLSAASYDILRRTETGQIRWYAAGIAVGAIFLMTMVWIL